MYLGNGRPGYIHRMAERIEVLEKRFMYVVMFLGGTLILDGRISDIDKLLAVLLK